MRARRIMIAFLFFTFCFERISLMFCSWGGRCPVVTGVDGTGIELNLGFVPNLGAFVCDSSSYQLGIKGYLGHSKVFFFSIASAFLPFFVCILYLRKFNFFFFPPLYFAGHDFTLWFIQIFLPFVPPFKYRMAL